MSAGEPPRRRRLTDEDHALWRSVTRSITPLKRRRPEPYAAPVPERTSKAAPPLSLPTAPARSRQLSKTPQPKAQPPLMPIERRLKQRLARGTVEIDARLDLHGRTQSEAHAVLLRFLHRAQGDGARTVLVNTGKGGDLAEGRGVLKRQVPFWLALPEFRSYVLGVETAHMAHGGEGALYVRLRRTR
jgi:DNA-nicking Smr family endonuclease